MKKIRLSTLLFLAGFFALVTFGFQNCSGDKTQKDESLLWKISGNGLEQPSYLYGTIHLLCPDDFEMKEKVKDAIGNSEQLILELDFDEPGMIASLQQHMYLPDSIKPTDYLNEEEYSIVETYFNDSLQMPFTMMKRIKPFFLISFTIVDFLNCTPVSPEQKLSSAAQEEEIEVLGLETIEEQAGFIDDIPLDTQAKMLLESITDYENMKKMFDEMVNAYLNENISKIDELMQEYMSEEYADIELGLLIERNQDWIEPIREFIQEKPSFIAVGAAHLIGEEGLIALLREQGYTVEAVF